MHRIDSSRNAGGLWQSNSNPATQISAAWLNDVQENLMGVLTAGDVDPVKGDYTQLATAIGNMISGLLGGVQTVPAGALAHFYRTEAPSGWVKAHGQAVSRTGDYAALFVLLGTTHGAGDGVTTFNLPNLQGEFIRSWDEDRGVDYGRAVGGWQDGDLQAHSHTISSNGSTATSGTKNISGSDTSSPRIVTTNTTGGAETRPRNIALLACLKL